MLINNEFYNTLFVLLLKNKEILITDVGNSLIRT